MTKRTWFQIARAGAFLSLLIFVADEGMARGGRGGGGGMRGGGGGFSRGGGGGFGGGGYSSRGGASTSFGRGGSSGSFNRGSAGSRGGDLSSGGTFSRGGSYSRPSSVAGNRASTTPGSRPGGAGQGQYAQGTRPGQGGSGTRYQAGANNNRGNGNRVNNGNINTGDINIDGNGGCCGYGGWVDHPVAAGIAVGAVAGMTAAAIGSSYYALPPGCPPYPYGGYTYYSCGGAYYQPQYEGDTVVYVTVPDPSNGQTTVQVQQ